MSSAPRRQGIADLAHAAGGETVLPNAAMRRDPMLRQMAMRSLAGQGRDPSRFTMGGRNSRNPGTGRPEFADYIPGVGWVDNPVTDTSSPFDTHLGGVSGTPEPAQFNVSPERQALSDASRRVQDMNNQRVMERAENFYAPSPEFGITDERRALSEASQRTQAANQMRVDARIAQAANPMPEGEGFLGPAPLPAGTPDYTQVPTLDQWSAIDTYDEWRASRNPAGKGFQDMPYGASVGAGASASLTSPFQNPQGVMGAQMPAVQQMPWSTPGTSGLGMARDSGSETPSILNSGYAPAGGPYGASQGWMNPFGQQGGGIQSQQGLGAFAGGQQNKQTPNYQQAFRY